MIILIMFLIIVLLGIIAWVTYWKSDTIWFISLMLEVILGTITTAMLIGCVFVHIPFCKNQRLIEYEQKYISITQAINADVSNTIILADQVAEYNSNVLKGRMRQDSKWLSALDYDFYYDLPLIELKGSKNEF